MKTEFKLLQDWYLSQCDGDWEHEFGIKICTLDNPGWSISIDLDGTELENKEFIKIQRESNDNDWIQCEVKEGKFLGAGGPLNLIDIINIFNLWRLG